MQHVVRMEDLKYIKEEVGRFATKERMPHYKREIEKEKVSFLVNSLDVYGGRRGDFFGHLGNGE